MQSLKVYTIFDEAAVISGDHDEAKTRQVDRNALAIATQTTDRTASLGRDCQGEKGPPVLILNEVVIGARANSIKSNASQRDDCLLNTATINTDALDAGTMSSDEESAFGLSTIMARNRMVRFVMIVLLALLLISAFTTINSISQYGFLVAMCWVLIGSLFLSLVYFVQHSLLQSRQNLLYPLNAAVEEILQEVKYFQEDWRNEYLLITDYAANPEKASGHDASETADRARARQNLAEVPSYESAPSPSRRKHKSLVFKLVVKPILPLFVRWRKQKRDNHPQAQQSQEPLSPIV